jgi:hypothetical protein
MKEADIFESWISNLGEGTWNLPETPEQLDKLKTLMTKELIVGPDATNATEQLYDLIGDDILFDRLAELADRDPRANAWNDTEVMDRIRELGIEMPEPSAPGNPAEPQTGATAPVAAEVPPAPVPQQPVAEEINAMRKAAGLPVKESVLTDSTGHTMDHILQRFSKEVANFKENGNLDDDLYDALYDYYFDDMPYGVKKARTGDPYEWVSQRLYDDLGLNEGWKDKLAGAALAGTMALGAMGGGSPAKVDSFAPDVNTGVKGSSSVISNPGDKKTDIKYQAPIKGQSAAIGEGSCNATMEGEYCPEHGLAECAMESTTAGSIAPVMGEGNNDDPINYNAAITSSYYESKENDSLLARIKSLALLK